MCLNKHVGDVVLDDVLEGEVRDLVSVLVQQQLPQEDTAIA